MAFYYRMATTQNEFDAIARNQCSNIIRPSKRDVVTGPDGRLVIEEIGEVPKPSGLYAQVKLDQKPYCKTLGELSSDEISANGMNPKRAEGFLREYGSELADEAYFKAQNDAKDPRAAFDTAVAELNDWQQAQQKAGYSRQQMAFLLHAQQHYGGMAWDSRVTVIPFSQPERITKAEAEAAIAAAEQAHRATLAPAQGVAVG